MWHFHCTREFMDFTLDDWLDNSKWFDIKLLVNVNGLDHTCELQNDSYSHHIKKILNWLNLCCDKLLHLGQNVGLKFLDLLEEEMEAICWMGNWNNSIYDASYSSKLPLGPIRKLAGFFANNKIYFNTQTSVEPPCKLLLATLIGKLVYCA
jgi:hypothetical protein